VSAFATEDVEMTEEDKDLYEEEKSEAAEVSIHE
jgi:hypothetical protein